ncbi:MAG: dTDP-4-dehydrorhamnose reductase, partial [Chlamydiales bacterium]
ELAPALWDVLAKGEAGVYHAACEGSCSWYDLAVATLEYAGLEGTTVEPCGTEDYPTPAVRPAYTVLDCSRLTALRGAPLADWRDALKTYLGNGDQ